MQMINKTIILFLFFSTIFGCAIFNSIENNKMEEKLRERVAGVYKAYKERNFEKFMDFEKSDYDKKRTKKKIIDDLKKSFPILIDYNIKEIKITGDKAKVKVAVILILDDKRNLSEIFFDYWAFKDNDWYLLDFGKIQ